MTAVVPSWNGEMSTASENTKKKNAVYQVAVEKSNQAKPNDDAKRDRSGDGSAKLHNGNNHKNGGGESSRSHSNDSLTRPSNEARKPPKILAAVSHRTTTKNNAFGNTTTQRNVLSSKADRIDGRPDSQAARIQASQNGVKQQGKENSYLVQPGTPIQQLDGKQQQQKQEQRPQLKLKAEEQVKAQHGSELKSRADASQVMKSDGNNNSTNGVSTTTKRPETERAAVAKPASAVDRGSVVCDPIDTKPVKAMWRRLSNMDAASRPEGRRNSWRDSVSPRASFDSLTSPIEDVGDAVVSRDVLAFDYNVASKKAPSPNRDVGADDKKASVKTWGVVLRHVVTSHEPDSTATAKQGGDTSSATTQRKVSKDDSTISNPVSKHVFTPRIRPASMLCIRNDAIPTPAAAPAEGRSSVTKQSIERKPTEPIAINRHQPEHNNRPTVKQQVRRDGRQQADEMGASNVNIDTRALAKSRQKSASLSDLLDSGGNNDEPVVGFTSVRQMRQSLEGRSSGAPTLKGSSRTLFDSKTKNERNAVGKSRYSLPSDGRGHMSQSVEDLTAAGKRKDVIVVAKVNNPRTAIAGSGNVINSASAVKPLADTKTQAKAYETPKQETEKRPAATDRARHTSNTPAAPPAVRDVVKGEVFTKQKKNDFAIQRVSRFDDSRSDGMPVASSFDHKPANTIGLGTTRITAANDDKAAAPTIERSFTPSSGGSSSNGTVTTTLASGKQWRNGDDGKMNRGAPETTQSPVEISAHRSRHDLAPQHNEAAAAVQRPMPSGGFRRQVGSILIQTGEARARELQLSGNSSRAPKTTSSSNNNASHHSSSRDEQEKRHRLSDIKNEGFSLHDGPMTNVGQTTLQHIAKPVVIDDEDASRVAAALSKAGAADRPTGISLPTNQTAALVNGSTKQSGDGEDRSGGSLVPPEVIFDSPPKKVKSILSDKRRVKKHKTAVSDVSFSLYNLFTLHVYPSFQSELASYPDEETPKKSTSDVAKEELEPFDTLIGASLGSYKPSTLTDINRYVEQERESLNHSQDNANGFGVRTSYIKDANEPPPSHVTYSDQGEYFSQSQVAVGAILF